MNRLLILSALIALTAPLAAGQMPYKMSVEAARTVIAELASHDFAKVEARFDDRMRAALPQEKLDAVWTSLEAQVGKFQQVRGVVVSGGPMRTVTLVCHFEHADLDALVTFDQSGRLAGLFFRPSETAAWKPPAYAQPENFVEAPVTVTTGQWHLPSTLTLPKGTGPFPAVILVHGSGPQDADETMGPNKPFKDLAWGLANRGIAVLRYTKRTKEYGPASLANSDTFTVNDETVDDARSAVALAAHWPQIDPHRIFVLGHSLGAIVAPRIAAGDPSVAGIILMAGAVTPIERLALDQIRTIDARDDVPPATRQKQIAAIETAVKEIENPALKPGTTINFLGSPTPSSYWLDLRNYHPARAAAELRIPMLFLQGERDYQVPPGEMALWKKALAGHENVTFELFPALNHLFEAGTGPSTPSEYMKPGHVDEKVVEAIAAWVQSTPGRH
jgi:dienelactone hydrolase